MDPCGNIGLGTQTNSGFLSLFERSMERFDPDADTLEQMGGNDVAFPDPDEIGRASCRER